MTPTEQELKSAVEYLERLLTHPVMREDFAKFEDKDQTGDAIEKLMDLAHLYLQARSELPERMDIQECRCGMDMNECSCETYATAFNMCLDQITPIVARLKGELSESQAREQWFDSLVEYKLKGKFQSLRAYVEHLESALKRAEGKFKEEKC